VPTLVHKGAQASLLRLVLITHQRGLTSSADGSLVLRSVELPGMAPGDYAVCLQSAMDLELNTAPTRSCVSGSLAPAGSFGSRLPSR